MKGRLAIAPDLPLNEDPTWVREKYDEAKELLAEVRLQASLPADLWQRVDDFYVATFMDGCTTFGADCACIARAREAPGEEE